MLVSLLLTIVFADESVNCVNKVSFPKKNPSSPAWDCNHIVIEPAEPVAPPASFFQSEDWVGMVIKRIG